MGSFRKTPFLFVVILANDIAILTIKTKDIIALLPFIFGAGFGGGVSIKGIRWLIQKYSTGFESFILGAIIGSIIYIASQISWSVAHPIALLAVLLAGILVAHRLTHAR